MFFLFFRSGVADEKLQTSALGGPALDHFLHQQRRAFRPTARTAPHHHGTKHGRQIDIHPPSSPRRSSRTDWMLRALRSLRASDLQVRSTYRPGRIFLALCLAHATPQSLSAPLSLLPPLSLALWLCIAACLRACFLAVRLSVLPEPSLFVCLSDRWIDSVILISCLSRLLWRGSPCHVRASVRFLRPASLSSSRSLFFFPLLSFPFVRSCKHEVLMRSVTSLSVSSFFSLRTSTLGETSSAFFVPLSLAFLPVQTSHLSRGSFRYSAEGSVDVSGGDDRSIGDSPERKRGKSRDHRRARTRDLHLRGIDSLERTCLRVSSALSLSLSAVPRCLSICICLP